MDIKPDRRSFLKGVLSVAAASLVIPTLCLSEDEPLIMGDGVYDDYAGLQAAFDGKPFSVAEGMTVIADQNYVMISGGNFLISRGLKLGRSNFICNSRFSTTPSFPSEECILTATSPYSNLIGVYFERSGGRIEKERYLPWEPLPGTYINGVYT